MAEKKYCGNAQLKTEPFWKIKLGLRASDLPQPNEAGFINIEITKRMNDESKLNVYVDEWKPAQQTTEPEPF